MSFIEVEEARRAARLAAEGAAASAVLTAEERFAREVEDRIAAVAAELVRRGVRPTPLYSTRFSEWDDLRRRKRCTPLVQTGVLVAVVDSGDGYAQLSRGRYRRVSLAHQADGRYYGNKLVGLEPGALIAYEQSSTAHPASRLFDQYRSDAGAVEAMHHVLAHFGLG